MVYLAADHRGFQLKQAIKQHFPEFVDVGALSYDLNDDYVDYAQKACSPTDWQPNDLAILICGSGHGMDMTANRYPHIRAILGFNKEVVQQGREHENANVLVLASDWTDPSQAIELINLFLTTSPSQEPRHLRRLDKLSLLLTSDL